MVGVEYLPADPDDGSGSCVGLSRYLAAGKDLSEGVGSSKVVSI